MTASRLSVSCWPEEDARLSIATSLCRNGDRTNLNQWHGGARFRQPLPQHVSRGHPGSVERLLAICGGWAPHTSFHIGQARDNACNWRRASKTSTRSGLSPEWSEPLSSAGKNSRYPGTSAAGHFPWEAETARREKHRRRAKCSRKNGPRCTSNPQDPLLRGRLGRRTELFLITDQRGIMKNFGKVFSRNAQRKNGGVAIHHRRDRGIERVLHAEFGGELLHARYDRRNSRSSGHWRW